MRRLRDLSLDRAATPPVQEGRSLTVGFVKSVIEGEGTRPRVIPALAALFLLALLQSAPLAQSPPNSIHRDLPDVTIPQLRALYASGKYTVTQVTQWHLDRIARYDGRYKAFLHVDTTGALVTAAFQDSVKKSAGSRFSPGPLWGIPIVVKGNTSLRGLVTTNGWQGYQTPGRELTAPADATIITKLKGAGAVILGHTNLPDFAASDTTMSSAGGRTGNAYNWRFSPGGSSGGTATAVAASFAAAGTGTDTSNSIRLPAGASGLVGVLPTRGLVSIHGIHPLDWLLDNAGPMTRNVTDAAILLDVMAGEDPKDFRTRGSSGKAQAGSYTQYLKKDAVKGKRFGVPAFILREAPRGVLEDISLRPETRAMFMKAVEALRSAGATVVFDDAILPTSFESLTEEIRTEPYRREGLERFLQDFGPALYHSSAEFAKAVGMSLPAFLAGGPLRILEEDSSAETNFFGPQRRALAVYQETLDRFRLDGYVYPALQMPPNDETIRQPDGLPSRGPHTRTGWANTIGVPAVVVPGGYYPNGLPFGIEFSARPWKDGDLLGWAFAYEQATQYRKPPVIVE
jgi:Asp-tRNA(Asn)/Glu-tRNA(Gln) amidotransferase A subunit family amidase